MKKILAIIGIFCIIIINRPATLLAEKTFGLPNDYLQYGAGARSLAMGSAFTGLADDGSASYWNPAALAFIDEYQLLTMYAPYRMDTHYSFASIAIPLGPKIGSIALSNVMLLSGEFQERNDLNLVTGNDKSIMKNAASASYAHTFYKRFSFGTRINFLQERVFSTSGVAFGLDASVYSKLWFGVSCGLTINNINRPKITLIEAPDIYGRNTRFGIAYRAEKDRFFITIDANKLEEQSAFYTMGLEVNPISLLSLRAGLNQHGAVTAGIGVNVWPFKIDYAFSGHEELGDFNKISLTYRWGNVYEANVEPLGKNKLNDSILLKGLYNELIFVTSVPNFEVTHWKLVIIDAEKKLVRSISGEAKPAEKILWNMKDDAGQPVKRGTYSYEFSIEYYNGKSWDTKGSFKLDFNSSADNSVDIKVAGEDFQHDIIE